MLLARQRGKDEGRDVPKNVGESIKRCRGCDCFALVMVNFIRLPQQFRVVLLHLPRGLRRLRVPGDNDLTITVSFRRVPAALSACKRKRVRARIEERKQPLAREYVA